MQFFRTAYFKKTSAVIFMALFVFVHAVKALHSHEFNAISKVTAGKNAVTIKANFSCSICDFQLAKDSDALTKTIGITVPIKSIAVYSHYYFLLLPSKFCIEDVRGPPASV